MNAVQTVTLGMGCFWSPEALFGHMPGVVGTRVGYAGGKTAFPTYRELGDHTETVQVHYDPRLVTFEQLAELFWSNHNPVNINDYKGKQYMSLLFYASAEQEEAIRRVLNSREERELPRPETRIEAIAHFYPAEERHQKYYLQRYPDAMEKLAMLYPERTELLGSRLAARLNGLAKGFTNMERVRNEIAGWNMDQAERAAMLETIKQIRW
ncbi:peptide-methionine (S)-S-oxide reductase MsrA [Paenibacillus sp. NEAU-GSW1]|uniref:peptide-methionine (S)-S-oxide reductase MsrA n=1 Tax=Paenibacillus sp. NEAU-GSW1 TaxID=2682486 RepID=UPI0012E27308|nr:peptide-methionine (S)-S-oxide reductase MsrA [Paenibacillus sp. NEAU-GSW1]MUT64810.1 peptide-methionine (S)-S-oxide reductase MsrA [Paenibacillus sp. NEAU-GSW1]